MKPRSPAVAQVGTLLSARVLGATAFAVTLVLLARWSSPREFGLVGAALGALTLGQTIADAGLTTWLVKVRAQDRTDARIPLAQRLATLAAGGFGVVVLAALVVLGLAERTFLAMAPLALWAAAERATETRLSLSLADGTVRVNAVSLMLRRALLLGAFVLVVGAGQVTPVLGFSTAAAVSGLVGLVHALLRVPVSSTNGARLRGGGATSIVAESRPYWLHSVASQARNLDVAIVGAVSGPVAAAAFALPARLVTPLIMASSAAASVLLPRASRADKEQVQRLLSAVVWVSLLQAPVYAAIGIAAPTLVPLLVGNSYENAVTPLRFLLLAVLASSVSAMLVAVAQGLGQASRLAPATLGHAGGVLAGIAVGAVVAGPVGAAVATAVASLAFLGVLARLVYGTVAQMSSEASGGAASAST